MTTRQSGLIIIVAAPVCLVAAPFQVTYARAMKSKSGTIDMRLAGSCIAASLVLSTSCWAAEEGKRFLEISTDNNVTAFDLSTVEMIQPGRFSIVSNTIDHPDIMKFKLKVLDTLHDFCKTKNGAYQWPEGKYAPPADVFTLGPPDLLVEDIKVENDSRSFIKRVINWKHPYERLARVSHGSSQLWCTDQYYMDSLRGATDGTSTKHFYDCKRGLTDYGVFHNPEGPNWGFVRPRTLQFREYFEVCQAVTHETPYTPE